jgi:predicted DNA-binding transcriptional regulator YafY
VHQLERVTNLLALLLSTRRHLTFDEIRNELKGQYPDNLVAARAAFERDKAILRDEGIPISSEVQGGDKAGITGYRIDRSAYELGDLQLTGHEAAALRIAVSALRMGQSWGEEALWKVDMDSGSIASPQPVIQASLPVDQKLPTLHEAMSHLRVVSFTYNGRPRELEPFGLLARSGWWYLVGNDRSVKAMRTFRVDRISSEVVLLEGETFERPVGFDVRTSFPNDLKELPDSIDVGGDIAKVRIDATDVNTVLGQYGPESLVERHSDGSATFVIPCANVQAFEHWLLGFLDRAEVLEPAKLRQHVVEWLTALARGVQA